MKFVNTAELKNETNHILKEVRTHKPVVVTLHGHPCAAIIPVTDEEVDDLIWEFSDEVQSRLKTAKKELKSGKTITLKEFADRHGLAR